MNEGNPYIQRLKSAGYRLTQARLTVLAVLEAAQGHLTSAQALQLVEQRDPAIGRASVFRSLELFTRLGILRPTYMEGSSTPTYVLLRSGHHHHVICDECRRFFEFDDCGLEALTANLEAEFALKISGHLLEFYGICSDCEADSDTRPEAQTEAQPEAQTEAQPSSQTESPA